MAGSERTRLALLAAAATLALAALVLSGAGVEGVTPAGALARWALEALLPPARTTPYGRRVLLLSDEPETVPGPGVLYADSITGPFRVYLYAVNGSGRTLRIGAVAFNPGARPVPLHVGRAGLGGPTADDRAAAAAAQSSFLASSGERTISLAPGQAAYLIPPGPVAVRPGQMVNAIVDASAGGRVRVATVATAATSGGGGVPAWVGPALAAPALGAAPAVLPPARSPADVMRGTFAHADWVLSVSVFPWVRRVRLTGAGDFVRGVSAVDGQPVRDNGDFGVLYRVRVRRYAATAGSLAALAVLASARWGWPLWVEFSPPLLGPWLLGPGARIFQRWRRRAEDAARSRWAGNVAQFHWMAPGAANLPPAVFVPLP